MQNGDFESPLVPANPSGFVTYDADHPAPAAFGWTVGGAGIDHVGSLWQAADNSGQSIDLNALDAGSISQTLTTEVGKLYEVTFALAGNPEGGDAIKSVKVTWTDMLVPGVVEVFTFDATNQSRSDMGWTPYSFQVTATSGASELRFASQNLGSSSGPALDSVRVELVSSSGGFPVPLPASAWAGFTLLGVLGASRLRGVYRAAGIEPAA